MFRVFAVFRVFLLFPHYFIPFPPLLGIFAISRGILAIFGGKKGFFGLLEAF